MQQAINCDVPDSVKGAHHNKQHVGRIQRDVSQLSFFRVDGQFTGYGVNYRLAVVEGEITKFIRISLDNFQQV